MYLYKRDGMIIYVYTKNKKNPCCMWYAFAKNRTGKLLGCNQYIEKGYFFTINTSYRIRLLPQRKRLKMDSFELINAWMDSRYMELGEIQDDIYCLMIEHEMVI